MVNTIKMTGIWKTVPNIPRFYLIKLVFVFPLHVLLRNSRGRSYEGGLNSVAYF